MKLWLAIAAVVFSASVCASAQNAIKSCDELRDEITKKLETKGVTGYTLTIVDKGKEAEGKAVGSCSGGTKSIVYSKVASASEPKPATEKTEKKTR